MVEVFKTNVTDPDQAHELLIQIHEMFSRYSANFDLEDCDKILRIECTTGIIESSVLIQFLNKYGCHAEVLPDEYIPFKLPSFPEQTDIEKRDHFCKSRGTEV